MNHTPTPDLSTFKPVSQTLSFDARLKALVVSLLSKVHNSTGLSYEMIVLIIGIFMTIVGLTTLVSFYFAYKARKTCKKHQNKHLFTALLVMSVVFYLISALKYRMIFIPAALTCNIILIILSYKFCKEVAAEAKSD